MFGPSQTHAWRNPRGQAAMLVFLALSPALFFSFGYHNDFWAWAYPANSCCSAHPESANAMAIGRWLASLMLNLQFLTINDLGDLWGWRLINITTTAMLAAYYLTIVRAGEQAGNREGPWIAVAIFTLPTMQLHGVWASNFAYFTPPLLLALLAAHAALQVIETRGWRSVVGWAGLALLGVVLALFFYPPSATFILVPAAHRLLFGNDHARARSYALLCAVLLAASYVVFFALHKWILLPGIETLPSMGEYHFKLHDDLIGETLVRLVSYIHQSAYLWSGFELGWLPYLVLVGGLGGGLYTWRLLAAERRPLLIHLALVAVLLPLANAPMLLAFKFSPSLRVIFTGSALLLLVVLRLTLSQLPRGERLLALVGGGAVLLCSVGVYGVSQLAAQEYQLHVQTLSPLSKETFHSIVVLRPEGKKRFHGLELRADFGNLGPISTIGDLLIGPRYLGQGHFNIAAVKIAGSGNLILVKGAVVVDTRSLAGGDVPPMEEVLAGSIQAIPRGQPGPMNAVDHSPYTFWEVWGQPFPITLELTLNTPQTIYGYTLTAFEAMERMPTTWELWGSTDLENWQLWDQQVIQRPWKAGEVRQYTLKQPVNAQGLRLVVTASAAGHGVRLYEFTPILPGKLAGIPPRLFSVSKSDAS